MDSIQDVSAQLMKPPRELAKWNFPLSQVVERYFDLLEDPSQIHYSDAALVIQNAVNAYVRRVEELYDETRSFSQKLISATKEPDEQQHAHKEKKLSKKSLIDFTNFQPLDFEKEVGKNINLKSQEGKPLKFLHRCFSQLENSRTNVQLNILDVNGEIIGKKYDFRCNQQMTKNGMLVDEFVPSDFIDLQREKRNSETTSLLPSKENTETDKTSGYSSNASSHDSNEKVDSTAGSAKENVEPDVLQSTQNLESSTETDLPLSPEPNLNESLEESLNKSCENSNELPSNAEDSQIQINDVDSDSDDAVELELILQDVAEPIELDTSPQDTPTETPPIETDSCPEDQELAHNDTDNDPEISENDMGMEDEQLVSNDTDTGTEDEQPASNDTDNDPEVSENNIGTEEEQLLNEENESLNEQSEPSCDQLTENLSISCKRTPSTEEQSKELENINISDVNDNEILNIAEKSENSMRRSKRQKAEAKELQPIPFKDGIPEKLAKNRSEFRLPCHISLLKRSPTKRKSTPKGPQKRRKTSMHESTESPVPQVDSPVQTEKMNMYSPTRPLFTAMKDEDHKGFRRSLDEKFKKQGFTVNYEFVSTLSMDLLGFHPCYTKSDPHVDSIGYSTPTKSGPSEPKFPLQRSSTPVQSTDPTSSLHPANLTPPMSPCSSDIFETTADGDDQDIEERVEDRTPPKPNRSDFENLVKHKIKEIYDELDLHNDDDKKIARWHAEIKPRLMEAERKPPFQIHQYGDEIIERLNANKRKIPFDDMVREQPREEVARYFSAALQLASTHNVDINPSEDLDSSIELILLE